jgi:serine/threonine protein kinase
MEWFVEQFLLSLLLTTDVLLLPFQADLWSVGVIMFEMLMGQVPFPANTLVELIGVLRTTEPVIPSHLKLSPNCRHLLHLYDSFLVSML